MAKSLVVVMAAYPVPNDRGAHMAPGTVAEVELTPEMLAHIAAGRLDRVDRPSASDLESKRPLKVRDAVISDSTA